MPKKIYNNFGGGLATNDKFMADNQFAVGRDIDIHRDYGYLKPGYTGTSLTNINQLSGLVVDFAVKIGAATDVAHCYAIEQTKVHKITMADDTIIATGGTYPYTLPAGKDGQGIFFFDSTATRNAIYYILEDNIGLLSADSFDDDWLSTVPANPTTLNQYAPHPYLVWNNRFWVGNYNKIVKFDGETGANGTVNASALTLPPEWIITALFSTNNYIGICVSVGYLANGFSSPSRYRTDCFVIFWDGISSTYNYLVPVLDNRIVSAINHNGIIHLFTEKRDSAGSVYVLESDRAKRLKKLKMDVAGSSVNLSAPYIHAVESYDNKVLVGGSDYDLVLAFGQLEDSTPFAFFQPFSNTAVSGGSIGAIKVVDTDKIYISTKVSTTYTIKKYTTGNSTSASWKPGYYSSGQAIRINYVKFYFKPLVASDSITVGIDTDYGTANSLGDITYTTYGAITSKRLNFLKKCHAFRPTISWNAGGVAISEVEVDFDYVSDL